MFIHPVKRDQGHFIVVGQFRGQTAFVTHLDDYNKNPQAADPQLTISIHDDLVKSKDIALVRADFDPARLKKEEVTTLIKDVFHIYCDTAQYKQVETLNSRPASFDWQAFIQSRLAASA
mmetsp:Transcript_67988/g.181716  ORF Transcript_67988/g.181716 Transcript_67988/m.181716 type:complete len:119 (+) Transcript_67988:334-690(+)